jgi:hypothetical protein
MIPYLMICSLMIPVNLWAAITPHLHSELSMQILHGLSTLVLLPLLLSLWRDRRSIHAFSATVLAVFAVVLIVVNSTIALLGMGVEYGWLDHLFLALGALSVGVYYLLETRASIGWD